ncbi:MAG TPA: aldolase/citrate lyase family protein [Umezawaea sp.]|nr:aldolase/citrate lyase family protein [Umezawaea sp.]
MTPRSYLYVPGDQPAKLAGAAGRGADALILDLEDAVSAPRKDLARQAVADHLAEPGAIAWVRINADSAAADVAAIGGAAGLAGVVVPKAEPESLAEVDRLLAGFDRSPVPVIAMLETARGIRLLDAVAAAPRVVRLGLGEADLAGELGIRPDERRTELWPIRSQVVVASAAARLTAPVGPVDTDARGTDTLRATTTLLLNQGFRARTAITPAQVGVINAVFTPTPEEIAAAARVLKHLADSSSGIAVDDDGRLIDAAVARTAQEVLSRAG